MATRRAFASLASIGLYNFAPSAPFDDSTRPTLHASALRGNRLPKTRYIVDHAAFRYIVNIAIIANAIQMGLATDLFTSDVQVVWLTCDHVFTVVFVLEMVLMISAMRRSYFKDPWLLFDCFVAVVSALDTWFLPLVAPSGNLNFFRIFRLLRLLRIAKITRVVPELAVVVEGLINSLRSMFWIFMLLLVILYAFAICCVQLLGRSDSGYPGYQEDQQIINQQVFSTWNNYEYFGTVYRAMMTLFGMVLLSEWPFVRQIGELHSVLVPFFVSLVILVAFGVLNVIIGIVVEKTTTAMEALKVESEESIQQERAATAQRLTELLLRFDTDGDCRISLEELESNVHDEEFKELLIELNLPQNFSAMELFLMLDTNADGMLSKSEFVNGIVRLVYSNSYQRQCALKATLGMLHREIKKLKVEMIDEMQLIIGNVVRETMVHQGAGVLKRLETNSGTSLGTATSKSNNSAISWNHIPDVAFVRPSADPTPLVSNATEHAGGNFMNTPLASWEPLKAVSLAPILGDHATGHIIRGSSTNTANVKEPQLLGCVRVMTEREDGYDCQGQAAAKASFPSASGEDSPMTLKQNRRKILI